MCATGHAPRLMNGGGYFCSMGRVWSGLGLAEMTGSGGKAVVSILGQGGNRENFPERERYKGLML